MNDPNDNSGVASAISPAAKTTSEMGQLAIQPSNAHLSKDAPQKLPLTLNQEKRLLVENYFKLNGVQAPAFNISCILRLDGPVSEICLRQSLADLIRRHEALRTRVIFEEGFEGQNQYQQAIEYAKTGFVQTGIFVYTAAETGNVQLTIHDLENLDDTAQSSEL
jgi:hypothetical protein